MSERLIRGERCGLVSREGVIREGCDGGRGGWVKCDYVKGLIHVKGGISSEVDGRDDVVSGSR